MSDFENLLKEQIESEDTESFEKVATDVKKIVQDKIATKSALMDKELAKIRQDSASTDKKQETDHVSSSFVTMVDPNDVLSYKTPGTQPLMLRKLKNGEYREADFIDLHGKTLEQAYDLTRHFIAHAREHEFRCVLIIHGKGMNQRPKAQLKSYVNHWLKQMKDVLAFHSAPDFKGGTGAVMIILKKGDKSSAINREEHARR
ncbi:Probable DNA endonuclease SmrA [Anaerobiospirillum thomasii]|uniref:Smr/MutS family protein n=1 Tax=Anaerobiospirillum thomasii TaxID=179995 RepID=UPI000D9CA3BD|nr:Smr/MutS family protein [Anaerobiospirillum thomasii]SPT68220.1 Probable DNA endonuclease SmrA [Anaerobiospirillum thomasii]